MWRAVLRELTPNQTQSLVVIRSDILRQRYRHLNDTARSDRICGQSTDGGQWCLLKSS